MSVFIFRWWAGFLYFWAAVFTILVSAMLAGDVLELHETSSADYAFSVVAALIAGLLYSVGRAFDGITDEEVDS